VLVASSCGCEGQIGLPETARGVFEFYGRNANGPVTVARRADDRKGQKSQAPRQPSPAKPRRSSIWLGSMGRSIFWWSRTACP